MGTVRATFGRWRENFGVIFDLTPETTSRGKRDVTPDPRLQEIRTHMSISVN
jgi:hypothetical protein